LTPYATPEVGSCNGSMMDRSSRAVVAFMVAPLAPVCLFTLYLTVLSGRTGGSWVDVASVILSMSLLVTLPITLIVGVPAYILIEKDAPLRRAQVLTISAVVGAVVGLGFLGSPHGGALLGLSAGVTFCLIWYRARDERPF